MQNIQNEILQNFNLNGFLFLNKPSGISSFFALLRIKKLFLEFLDNFDKKKELKRFIPKIGHVGTLDPFATGLLLVLIGDATKLTSFFQNYSKEYIAKIKLGLKTDSYDIKGNIIKECKTFFKKEDIQNILKKFLGGITQKVPIYSAVSINGKRLYQYAREGKKIDLPERNIFIDFIELLDFDEENQLFSIKIRCSKGTYIRSLANDIGESLNSFATLIYLERTKIGNFILKNSIKLDEIFDIFCLKEKLISLEKYFSVDFDFSFNEKLEIINIEKEEVSKILNGNFNFLKNKTIYYNKLKLLYKDKILGIFEIKKNGNIINHWVFKSNIDFLHS